MLLQGFYPSWVQTQMRVPPPVLLLWMASCSGTSPEGWQMQVEYHLCRLSTNIFLAAPLDMAMSPSKTLLLVPHRCLWVLLMRTAFVVTDVSLWKGEYSGTKMIQGYITHFSIYPLCWMYIKLLSLLSSTCTSTVCMEHAHRPSIFKAICTDNILAGLSTNTGNNLFFH